MKKLLLLLVVVLLTGCGTKEDLIQEVIPTKESEQASNVITNTPAPEKTDKETIEITFPASFFEDGAQRDFDSVDTSVIYNVTVNSDGSETYIMDKIFHDKLITDYKKGTDEVIQDTLNSEEAYLSFIDITYNNDMSEFKIMCDREKYNEFDTFITLAFYMQGEFYRILNGEYDSPVDTVVYFIDADTGEIIYTADSSELDKETFQKPTLTPTQAPKKEVKQESLIEEDYSDWIEFRTSNFDLVREGMWSGEVVHVEDNYYIVSPRYYNDVLEPYMDALLEMKEEFADDTPKRESILSPDAEYEFIDESEDDYDEEALQERIDYMIENNLATSE